MAEAITYTQLATELRKRQLRPVYLLHGEEGYYIDKLVRMVEACVPETDRDFNLFTLYAPETDPNTVMDACRQYPMMGDRIVVILKEVQNAKAKKFLQALASYAKTPTPTTTLVICNRGETASAKALTDAITKAGGAVFESKKLKDAALQRAISDFVKERGLSIDPKALSMLTDYVGNDMSRIDNEVGKLTVTLGRGAMITPESIERNIGFSKDFNNYEYISAIARRDAAKAMKIVRYFTANPKNNPVPVTVAALFNLFQNTLIAMYSPDRSERGVMTALGMRWPIQVADVMAAIRCYSAWNVINIISAIRRCDVESKGGGSRFDPYMLLQQLTFYILNPEGAQR